MSRTDSQTDAARVVQEEHADPILALILSVAGAFDPLAGVTSAILTHFSNRGAEERTKELFGAIDRAIRAHEVELGRVKQRIESPEFLQALIVAVTEAIRTPDLNQIRRFGAVLGHSVAEGRELQEAAAYIRDLTQLTETDLSAITILYSIQEHLVSAPVVSTDPNLYTGLTSRVLAAVDEKGLSRDDFYARCSRLTGFGLALEVQRNNFEFGPGDHCFRLTGRAAILMRLLEGARAVAA